MRIAHLLSAVARQRSEELQGKLEAARSEVMGPFSGALASLALNFAHRGHEVLNTALVAALGIALRLLV